PLDVGTVNERIEGLNEELSVQDHTRGERRAERSYEVMRTALREGALFTISTTLWTYDSMVMESLTVPRDASRANSVHFTATFKHITKVSSVEVSAPQTRMNKGREPTREANSSTTEKAQQRLTLSLVKDSILNVFGGGG